MTATTAFKILTHQQWADFERERVFRGAPVDIADGYIHLSTAAQLEETLAKHFAGQTDLMIVDLATSLPQVKAGKLRALGTTSQKPLALVPGVPPIAGSLPGYEFGYWNALYAPAGTPAPVVQRLNELMHKAMGVATVRSSVEQAGMEPALSTAAELQRFQLSELERWGGIVKAAGISPE